MAAAQVNIDAGSLNYYRYSRLVMVVPARYMARIFAWLRDGSSQSLDEFFKANSGLLKFLNKHEKKKILEGADPAKMDITLLYKLLLHAGNIPSANPPWHSPVETGQQPSLGQVLYQVKGVRNENAHKDPEQHTKVTNDDLDTLAMTQKHLLTQMLTLAGQLAGKSQDTIAEAVTSMEADVATDRHNEGGINLERFMSLAMQKLSLSKHRHAVPEDEYPDEDEQYGDLYEDEDDEREYEEYLYDDIFQDEDEDENDYEEYEDEINHEEDDYEAHLLEDEINHEEDDYEAHLLEDEIYHEDDDCEEHVLEDEINHEDDDCEEHLLEDENYHEDDDCEEHLLEDENYHEEDDCEEQVFEDIYKDDHEYENVY